MTSLPDPAWIAPLQKFRSIQIELSRLAPYRDTGLAPEPAATPEEVLEAEACLGHRLPASYRQFLLRSNGWQRFFDGASLLGTEELGRRDYSELAWMAFRAAGSPERAVRRIMRVDDLIVFGVDAQCTTLFAFETCYGSEADFHIVSWVGEMGTRSTSFAAWLTWLSDLCEHEQRALAAPNDARSVA